MNKFTHSALAEIEQLLMQNEGEAAEKVIERLYRMGYCDALSNYAIWKDGVQCVGCLQRPITDVVDEFNKSNIPLRY